VCDSILDYCNAAIYEAIPCAPDKRDWFNHYMLRVPGIHPSFRSIKGRIPLAIEQKMNLLRHARRLAGRSPSPGALIQEPVRGIERPASYLIAS
jgi:hypothetical protein